MARRTSARRPSPPEEDGDPSAPPSAAAAQAGPVHKPVERTNASNQKSASRKTRGLPCRSRAAATAVSFRFIPEYSFPESEKTDFFDSPRVSDAKKHPPRGGC